MFKIGLTGCMGSGKNAVADLLAEHGNVLVSDSDAICEWLWKYSDYVRNTIDGIFGTLDKKEVAKIVFDNAVKRRDIDILFKQEIEAMHNGAYLQYENDYDFFVVNAPLLIESGQHDQMDYVIVVDAERETCIERVLKRNPHLTREDIEKRLALQMPFEEKKEYANYVIENNGDLKELDMKVENLYNSMLKLKQERI